MGYALKRPPAVQKTMGVVVFLCLFQVVLLKIGLFHPENWPGEMAEYGLRLGY